MSATLIRASPPSAHCPRVFHRCRNRIYRSISSRRSAPACWRSPFSTHRGALDCAGDCAQVASADRWQPGFIGQGLSNLMGSLFRRTRQADRSRAAASTTTPARRLRWRRYSRRISRVDRAVCRATCGLSAGRRDGRRFADGRLLADRHPAIKSPVRTSRPKARCSSSPSSPRCSSSSSSRSHRRHRLAHAVSESHVASGDPRCDSGAGTEQLSLCPQRRARVLPAQDVDHRRRAVLRRRRPRAGRRCTQSTRPTVRTSMLILAPGINFIDAAGMTSLAQEAAPT